MGYLRDAAYEFAEGLGIESPAEDFITYLEDAAELQPGKPEELWAHVDRGWYDAFCRDQEVEARVEALSDR